MRGQRIDMDGCIRTTPGVVAAMEHTPSAPTASLYTLSAPTASPQSNAAVQNAFPMAPTAAQDTPNFEDLAKRFEALKKKK
jgi:hypothetical protein